MGVFSDDEALNHLRLQVLDAVTRGTLADGVWLRFAYTHDSRVFEAGRDAIKRLPATWRRWDADRKKWWLSEDGLFTLADDIPCIHRVIEAWKKRQQTREYDKARHEGRVPQNIGEAFTLLCLTPDAPIELVQSARRILALKYHPDRGGNTQKMQRINNAADMCQEWIAP